MITFNEFLERKNVAAAITECANLMAEMDVEPHQYIYECLKEIDPVLAEGWMDGIKNFAGRAWNAAKQIGSGVWDGGGLKHGLKKAGDTMAGPAAKFDAAERALVDLEKVLNDEKFAGFMSSTGRGSVLQYVQAVKKALMKDKEAIPQLMAAQVKQDYGTRKAVNDQENNAGKPATAAAPAPAAAKPAAPAGGASGKSPIWTPTSYAS